MEGVLTVCENLAAHVRRFGRRRMWISRRTSVNFPADVCGKK